MSTGQLESFCHEALFYAGGEEFLAGVLAFVHEGLAVQEPVLVAVGPEKISALRAALGVQAERVDFADIGDVGRNPARIIPHWQAFLDAHPDRPVRGVGEPIWQGRGRDEMVECQVHERLLNVAFGGRGAWKLLCPYDTQLLPAEVIQEARRSHPMVITAGQCETSPPFLPAQHSMAELEQDLPEPTGPVAQLVFDHRPESLALVRAFVAEHAQRAGLADADVEHLVLAANELATNSMRHGPGHGTVRLWQEAQGMVCEVKDSGSFTPPPLIGRQRPGFERVGGRGLWLANQLCDLVQIRTEPGGTVVRLHLRPGQR